MSIIVGGPSRASRRGVGDRDSGRFLYAARTMAANKTRSRRKSSATKHAPSRKKKPAMNKSAFVRTLPSSMPGAEVVRKAKEAGLAMSVNYVYRVRSLSHAKATSAKVAPAAAASAPVVKRGPGRPRKVAAVNGAARGASSTGGLVAEIERIVEAKVSELLKARLGALFR
jgi:hypothetical protein